MKTFWRISNHVDLGGWGGRKFSSRWSSLGRRVVYLAESPAGAMLEVMVHFKEQHQDLPRIYTLLKVESGLDLETFELEPQYWTKWQENEGQTQSIGDAWLGSRKTVLARVPSAIMPYTWNYLLNPEHPDASQVRIAEVIRERFDSRLFRSSDH